MANLTIDERQRIISTGYQLMGRYRIRDPAALKMGILKRSLASQWFKYSRQSVRHWWKNRDNIRPFQKKKYKTGYQHGNTYINFKSDEQLNRAITVCEKLAVGEHQPDGAQKLDCCVRTLRGKLAGKVTWKVPHGKNVGHNRKVSANRVLFCKNILTKSRRRVKKKYENITHLDHKWFSLYGFNRRSQLQCRRKGSAKPLRPMIRALHNPKIHCLVAANGTGSVALYQHLNKVKKKRGKGYKWEHEKVNAKTMSKAIEATTVIPMMKASKSKIVLMDCVRVNHSKAVVNVFNKNGIEVYPSNGYGVNQVV